ncbi:hypothetical protein POM88_031969 [Heracleum sosnowskyi]|uniref:Uncharacterized protein n=1 Tax=Heracleum sosnowskyi TaxID=360622 RepID=A0AAD8HZQ5_9APIA|nr:hypothetical protein POM88_031969 [Heracleum sosnowskyi]
MTDFFCDVFNKKQSGRFDGQLGMNCEKEVRILVGNNGLVEDEDMLPVSPLKMEEENGNQIQMQLGSLEQYLAPDEDSIKIKIGDPPSIELKIGFTDCVRCDEAFKPFVHFYVTRVEMEVCREDPNETWFY